MGLRTDDRPHRRNLLSKVDCQTVMKPKVQQVRSCEEAAPARVLNRVAHWPDHSPALLQSREV